MLSLVVTFADGRAFLDAFFPNGALGGVLVETGADYGLGEPIDVEVRFHNGPKRPFHLAGRVAWRRLKGAGPYKPGVGIEFLPTERLQRDALLEWARGGGQFLERGTERIPAKLRVRVKARGLPERTERTADLSEGGLFVATPAVIPVGEEVDLVLLPPWSLRGVRVRARVTWHRPAPKRGMGVMFLFDDAAQREKIVALLGSLQE